MVVTCPVVVEGELRGELGHGQTAQERVAGVALEEPAPEGVEQHDTDPLAGSLGQQPLDGGRDVREAAHGNA
jgi:hypothetical protein